ncbi:D-glycero-D-manno-heptose 1,7-bisphosphate phosphatase [Tistlia consotensis]|uniref:D-glycero-D-manno-heptose 1,7-bisphosphate phosphatase n=1 Tax=Tistlia consotensis USBA 355 TaxID=560819 RepID=A0A1Y6CRF0_9PROT|nr:sugar phosphate nucleotidyltransferase [Tistlia consotensis]SMF71789.1 D-glycero-D-manno-heptose 1,7-bisphosphate phosphatase [Tistlia consotensis USBA 355]SNS06276.1 D-glycero-D-manno-heptose 1,7-bisphosphate phosphatase [Tistlia consotensis]
MLNQAVFLVGGLGSRLGAMTRATPKPLLEVGGRPFLDCLIEQAARHGLHRVLLLCGHLAQAFAERYRGGGPGGAAVTVAVEPAPAGTGGALRHAAGLLDERFLLVNGDTFFDVNWLDLLTLPAGADCVARLALRDAPPGVGRYDGVELAGTQVVGFAGAGSAGPVNGGLYLVDRSILGWIDALPCSIEHDVFPRLAAAGRLAGRIYDRFFLDIGVPADFARAQAEIPARFRRPAVFLSRTCLPPAQDRARPGETWPREVLESVKQLNDLGCLVVLTGPPGRDAAASFEAFQAALQPLGAHLDAVADAPRLGPGEAVPWPCDPERSLLISCDPAELAAARAQGIEGALFAGDLARQVRALAARLRGPEGRQP